jgi:hypothetical protein
MVGGYLTVRERLAATRALSRRRVLAVSTMMLPLAATASCSVPDLLRPPPGLSASVRTLRASITAEQALIGTYQHVIAAYPALAAMLRPFLAQHEDHLAQLKSRLIIPPHVTAPPLPAPSAATVPAGSARGALSLLEGAERAAATSQLERLSTAPPSQAQLYASIAASEATHAVALAALSQESG